MPNGILQVCLSSGWGGLEMYPCRITPTLKERGWQVYGLALSNSRVADTLANECLDVQTFPSTLNAIIHAGRIKRWMKQNSIGIVHCHKSSDLSLVAVLKMLMPSLRVVFTEHMGVSRPKRDAYHRWTYSKVDQVLAISQATLARNRKALPVPASKLSLLYQGVNPAQYPTSMDEERRQQLRLELGIQPDQVAVAVAARLTPGKGQKVLVEALSFLPDNSPVVDVFIGGKTASEGAQPDYLKVLEDQMEKDGVADRVILAGFRSNLPEWLLAMDIICVPSRNEAFGLAAIEAMAAQRPVIGSDTGALPEILDGVGRLVPHDDPKAWAEAIQAWVNNPQERDAMARKGRARVEERFTTAQHLDGLEKVYRGKPLA